MILPMLRNLQVSLPLCAVMNVHLLVCVCLSVSICLCVCVCPLEDRHDHTL